MVYNIENNMDLQTLQTITQNFVKELEDAKSGKKTSLPFATNHLRTSPLVKDGEEFQALVIGGTMCKNARVKKQGEKLKILSLKEVTQPPFITKGDFLRFIDQELFSDVRVVALNFAYELQSVFDNDKLDGILVRPSKENTFTGLQGEKVGQTIETHIRKTRNQDIIVSCANDTICLLLSGLIKAPWEHLAAGIVGTGFNIAIFLDQHTAVNLESGSFTNFPQSEEGKAIDASSAKPGQALFEKEVSGGYLFKHFNALVKKRNIDYQEINSTWELKKLALKNIPTASALAKELIAYSASLVACQIAGITLFMQRDMGFIMDGSFFWDEKIYIDSVESRLKELVPEYKVTFIKVKDTTVVGAAKLVA